MPECGGDRRGYERYADTGVTMPDLGWNEHARRIEASRRCGEVNEANLSRSSAL